MQTNNKFAILFPKLIKATLYGDFIVVVVYPDKPESDPFMLGWRGASYFETYEQVAEMRAMQEEMAIEDMSSRKTKSGFNYDVVDVVFREEIEHEY